MTTNPATLSHASPATASAGPNVMKNQSGVQPAAQSSDPSAPVTTNPATISHASPATASAGPNVMKILEVSSQPNSTTPRSTDGTILSSNVATVSKDGKNATNFNRNSTPSVTLTTTGGFSRVTRSAAPASASTATPGNFTVTYSTPLAAMRPSDNSSVNPTGTNPTSPTVKQDSPTQNFNPIQQTTEANRNFSSPSTASSHSEGANANKTNKGGVISGVIVGVILVSVLIGLIGYAVCGKRRSQSFSHRRFYDETRSDPVLHLDNSLGPYDTSFGCASDDKTSRADTAEEGNAARPSDGNGNSSPPIKTST
ncbi:PREDICTED: mucin-15 [Buceros rhinoceros silvestris]|uniref:mucin-15 n=1 Tax=Buceros rhinoceros silvestris TaxID=175836 RepID=UPI0005280D04|nr:PREDICTED: mucin-15 [Buceros rhinoceros silvestris]